MPDAGNSQTYDDDQLVRYLIGSLDEQDAERFDELSVSDDEFAGRLRTVENDLIDAHARGELSAEMRAGFEAHYLSRPGRMERLRFAEAWAFRQSRAASTNAAAPVRDFRYRPARRIFVWPLGVAAAIVVVVLGYVLLSRSSLSVPSRQTAPPTVATEEPKSPPQAAGSGATTSRTRAAPVAIVLMPSTRGIREIASFAIPSGARTVEARLVLDGDDFPTYDVTLKDFGDRVLWNGIGLTSSSAGPDRVVVATFDAGVLKPQRYTLDLRGHRASGGSEAITSYPFRVVLN
jgi:hypothetical protein